MRFRFLPELTAALLALGWGMPLHAAPERVDIARVAADWTTNFDVRGLKSEPTFVEHVAYSRQGDRFTLDATMHGQRVETFAVDVDPAGAITVAACPDPAGCVDGPPNGFLATAAVLSALRAGRLAGTADLVWYAARPAVCIPLEALQPTLAGPVVLDPCFDLECGAVLAHRRRFDQQFGGPTLDEGTLRLTIPPPAFQAIGE